MQINRELLFKFAFFFGLNISVGERPWDATRALDESTGGTCSGGINISSSSGWNQFRYRCLWGAKIDALFSRVRAQPGGEIPQLQTRPINLWIPSQDQCMDLPNPSMSTPLILSNWCWSSFDCGSQLSFKEAPGLCFFYAWYEWGMCCAVLYS